MDENSQEVKAAEEPLVLFPDEVARKPFLKWAGGKTQLIPELSRMSPLRFNKYIEPFIGGGSFYFFLNPGNAVISDSNEELIVTYRAVRNQVEDVIGVLKEYRNEEAFFYQIRALLPERLSVEERAARFIFLNKTCFNGLYRVNKRGQFNVPYGKGNGDFLNQELLRNASEFLQQAEILHGDYLEVLRKHAEEGDFVFLDPPYYPVGRYADFKRYTKEFFYHDDHMRLREEFGRLVSLGCYVILTNSDHPAVLDLYKDFPTKIVETKRLISSNPNTRTGKDIIVIGKK